MLRLKILRKTGQFPSQTTTSGSQLGGGEIITVELCVTNFDAVFDSNLKGSDLLTTQLCCTSFEIADSPLHHEFSNLLERFIAECIESRESEWFPCISRELHSLLQKLAEFQTKVIELKQHIDALQISAANATAATDHRVDALQSSTENATRTAVSDLRRLEHEFSQCYILLIDSAQFSRQQPSNQHPQFQHSQFPPQHAHPQPPSSCYPPYSPSNNQPPQHFPTQKPPLQTPYFDPSMNHDNLMNAVNPRAPTFEILGRRVECVHKLIRVFYRNAG